MTHKFRGERVLMRIFFGEGDRAASGVHKGKPLHQALLLTLREMDFAGATLLRGTEGFGASARAHTSRLLDLSLDLPLVLEVVETAEKIQEILPELDALIGGGLVTLERVRVILYRPAGVPDSERWMHRIEGLQPADSEGENA